MDIISDYEQWSNQSFFIVDHQLPKFSFEHIYCTKCKGSWWCAQRPLFKHLIFGSPQDNNHESPNSWITERSNDQVKILCCSYAQSLLYYADRVKLICIDTRIISSIFPLSAFQHGNHNHHKKNALAFVPVPLEKRRNM